MFGGQPRYPGFDPQPYLFDVGHCNAPGDHRQIERANLEGRGLLFRMGLRAWEKLRLSGDEHSASRTRSKKPTDTFQKQCIETC